MPTITTGRSVEEKPVPTRAQQLKRLASGEEFDVLVVGGGATGDTAVGPGCPEWNTFHWLEV